MTVDADEVMAGYQYVWLFWSLAFLAVFAAIYVFARRQRRQMLLVGAATAPFGLTEPLFVPEYWAPPSLFDLAARTGFDLESIIFTFSVGGIAAVLFNLVTSRESRAARIAAMHAYRSYHALALATPAVVFLALVPLGWNPIYPALIAMAAGATATQLCRPDLLAKTLLGGLLFLVFYSVFLFGVRVTAPGYIEGVWNLPALSGVMIAGIPLEEFLFGMAFGLYWAGIYEHLAASKTVPIASEQRNAPAGER